MVEIVHSGLSFPLDTSAQILLDLFQDLALILLDLFEDLHHCSVVNDVAIDNKAWHYSFSAYPLTARHM